MAKGNIEVNIKLDKECLDLIKRVEERVDLVSDENEKLKGLLKDHIMGKDGLCPYCGEMYKVDDYTSEASANCSDDCIIMEALK